MVDWSHRDVVEPKATPVQRRWFARVKFYVVEDSDTHAARPDPPPTSELLIPHFRRKPLVEVTQEDKGVTA